jgi:hypothetical protein
MIKAVVTNFMAGRRCPLHNFWARLHLPTDNEEGIRKTAAV